MNLGVPMIIVLHRLSQSRAHTLVRTTLTHAGKMEIHETDFLLILEMSIFSKD